MEHVKLIKEPGFLLDLLFIFLLKFNKQHLFENLPDESRRSEDEEYLNTLLSQFEPIPEDLALFFHIFKDRTSFLSLMTFTNYTSMPPADYSVEFLQNKLSDHALVIRKLIKFCFRELTEEEIDKCAESNVQLFAQVKKSGYPEAIKNALYEFFIDPIPYIQKLQFELMAKSMQLSSYYEKNYQTLLDLYAELSTNPQFEDHLNHLWDMSCLEKKNVQHFASFCLLNKYYVSMIVNKNAAIYLFGCDYANSLFTKQQEPDWLKLEEFGAAVGEESRVGILNYIEAHGEVSCKDLEKAFHFSGSTVYHHLTIMLKARVLKRRSEGKTILYSVNRKFMDAVIESLRKYSSNGGQNDNPQN